jgi:hypothetical protein
MGASKTSGHRTDDMTALPFTAELRREESALNAAKIGEPRPEISNELKIFWHARTLNRTPDAEDVKHIVGMHKRQVPFDVISTLLELHQNQVLLTVANKFSRKLDPRD